MNSHKSPKLDLSSFIAIIIDFDGVIADSERAQMDAWRWALTRFKVAINDEKLIQTVGMKDKEIANVLAEKEHSKEITSRILEAKISKMNEMYKNNQVLPVPGVINFIKKFYRSHILAIATNSSSNRAAKYCESFHIDICFKTIVTGKGELRPKPHPDIYLKALEELALLTQQCVVIEDSIAGLKSAQNAGLKRIGFVNVLDEKTLKKYSNWVIGSFEELI